MRSLIIILMIFALLNAGCASSARYSTASSDGHTHLATAGGGGSSIGAHAGHDHGKKYEHVRGEGKVALWVAVGIALTAVVVIDLLILPFTHHDPFPCCRGVISVCH